MLDDIHTQDHSGNGGQSAGADPPPEVEQQVPLPEFSGMRTERSSVAES